jgi:hypothetical protein
MSDSEESATVTIRLTRAQALAAGSVLSGFVQHQRERLGDQAASNVNLQNVSAVVRAIEAHVGPLERSGGERRPRRD